VRGPSRKRRNVEGQRESLPKSAAFSQVMFIGRDDILNLFVVTNLPLPAGALPDLSEDDEGLPF
jgi:hypothetical protein